MGLGELLDDVSLLGLAAICVAITGLRFSIGRPDKQVDQIRTARSLLESTTGNCLSARRTALSLENHRQVTGARHDAISQFNSHIGRGQAHNLTLEAETLLRKLSRLPHDFPSKRNSELKALIVKLRRLKSESDALTAAVQSASEQQTGRVFALA